MVALILSLLLQLTIDVPVWNPQALHDAIAEAADLNGGMVAPVAIRITGVGYMRTQGIENLPGLRIECGPRAGIMLQDAATEDLFVVPERAKSVGGIGVYQHHTILSNCTLDGNASKQTGPRNLYEVYNSGFQSRIEGSHLKNSSGYCVYGERTALNLYILNTDFSDCQQGAGYFDFFDMFAGILKIENGQIDNCGDYAFTVRTAKTSGPGGHLAMFHFEALEFEWQRGTPKAAFRIISNGSHRNVILYQSITLTTWIGDGRSYQMEAVISESGSGERSVHRLVNVAARSAQVPWLFTSTITGVRVRGRNGFSDTRFQDQKTIGL